ncbi:MAG: hypothetical protein NTX86_03390 [Candidatus Dependentiae bacterium]|nr:hypothetical protein [Candidatus Dependentiae bacterium]
MNIIYLFCMALLAVGTQLQASILIPASLTLGSVGTWATVIQLLLLFCVELYFLRTIIKESFLKMVAVAAVMNVISAVLVSWGPVFVIKNVITGKFIRLLAYTDIKDTPLLAAIFYGAIAAGLWIILNVAIEMVIVLLFFHNVNRVKLFKILVGIHIAAILLGIGFTTAQSGYKTMSKKRDRVESVRKPSERRVKTESKYVAKDKNPGAEKEVIGLEKDLMTTGSKLL